MPRVVTCLLINSDGELLILKRSNEVRTYQGMWGGVAGYVEENEKPVETAYKELREEVGLDKEDVELINEFDVEKFSDVYKGIRYDWEIFPFLFRTEKKSKLHIDWEHTDYRWISPSEIEKINTVPHFRDIVEKILK